MDRCRTPVVLWRAGRGLLALGCIGVPIWVALTRWGPLVTGHPAYPVALAATLALGVLLAVRAAARPPRPGRWRATTRIAGALLTVLVLTVLVLAALVWLRPVPAEPVAVAAAEPSNTVDVVSTATTWELRPRGGAAGAGVVFYPGALVDPRGYLALLRPLAEQGHLVAVVKPPLGIALINTGAASGVLDVHREVARWVVGGHSLGGVAAASYAAGGDPRVRGLLLLWASYPAPDLSGSGLAAASISGERDGLTTPADVQRTSGLLPPGTVFTVVPGGVHAFFGGYGPQRGDGEPATTREAAQRVIVAATAGFVAGV